MNQQEKLDLVVIQAFPANQTISKGIIEFLSDYFTVHFINLPGFHPAVPPLKSPAVSDYVLYAQRELEKLNLDKYVLAGISFGFLLANMVKLDPHKCIAILGSGPYLGKKYLRFSRVKRNTIYLAATIISRTNLISKIWRTRQFARLLGALTGGKSADIVKVVQSEVDPHAFTITAKLLMKHNHKISFHADIPYILLINPNDKTIDYYKVTKTFTDNIPADNLRVILTSVEHFPKQPTYEYFTKTFTKNEISAMFDFLDYIDKKSTTTPTLLHTVPTKTIHVNKSPKAY